jgi:hypothetical protein
MMHMQRQLEFVEQQLLQKERREDAAVRMQALARGFLSRLRMGIRHKPPAYSDSRPPGSACVQGMSEVKRACATASAAAADAHSAVAYEGGRESGGASRRREPQQQPQCSSGRNDSSASARTIAASVATGDEVARASTGGVAAVVQGAAASVAGGAGGGVGVKERCVGKELSLDLSKLPEHKDIRGKVPGQKASVQVFRGSRCVMGLANPASTKLNLPARTQPPTIPTSTYSLNLPA